MRNQRRTKRTDISNLPKRTDPGLHQLELELDLHHTAEEVLRLLRRAGATRLDRVAFRANRSTIWSLTREGRALNLHEGYRTAPTSVLQAFSVIVTRASRPDAAYEGACRAVREWSGIDCALRRLRDGSEGTGRRRRVTRCQGTNDERVRMRDLYELLNRTRFRDSLPKDVPLRISRRMKTRLGHMAPEGSGEEPTVSEIALNRILFRRGNEDVLRETLLHEMAHVAAYLFDGHAGHGPPWRRWAAAAGCHPGPCIALPVRLRRPPGSYPSSP